MTVLACTSMPLACAAATVRRRRRRRRVRRRGRLRGSYDACGVCNGPGDSFECGCEDIPAGTAIANGNQLDALGVCGGDCAADADGDGVCDDVDDCVGAIDACGVCNGPGDIYECGCEPVPQAIAIATATNWTNAACVR